MVMKPESLLTPEYVEDCCSRKSPTAKKRPSGSTHFFFDVYGYFQ